MNTGKTCHRLACKTVTRFYFLKSPGLSYSTSAPFSGSRPFWSEGPGLAVKLGLPEVQDYEGYAGRRSRRALAIKGILL